MLRCHVRYRTLAIVLSELYRYRRDMGIDVRVCALMDRCCPDVQELLEDYSRAPWFFTIDAPRRSLDKDGEHFMELLNVQMDAMEERWPDLEWIYAQDDDRWFEPVHITEELPRALADDSKDVYFCRSLFFWNDSDTFNTERQHDSALLYRHCPGARWSGRRILNVPDEPYDAAVMSGRTGVINTPLLDFGTFTADDRLRVYTAFACAGKKDAYVQSIYAPPALLKFPRDFAPDYGEWKDLWKERWE
jgi:hypothetical protein